MKSIMHDKADHTCYLCMHLHSEYATQTGLEEHHAIYGWGLRKLSEKYGLKVYLCPQHHRDSPESIHNNTSHDPSFDQYIKAKAQQAFEEHYPNLSFIEIFGKNYAENRIKSPSERDFESIPKGFREVENESTERMVNI